MKLKGMLAVFVAMVMLLSTYAFAEETALGHGREQTELDEEDLEEEETLDTEVDEDADGTQVADTNASDTEQRETGRERRAQAEPVEPTAEDTVAAEVEIGEGLTQDERAKLGTLISALNNRAREHLKSRESLTAEENAMLRRQINERLQLEKRRLVQRHLATIKERNMERRIAREMLKRATVTAEQEVLAEVEPVEAAEELIAIEQDARVQPLSVVAVGPEVVRPELVRVHPESVLAEVQPEEIRALVERHPRPFLKRLLHWAKKDPEKVKHMVRQVLRHRRAEVVRPGAEIVRPEPIRPEIVRQHIPKIREHLRDKLEQRRATAIPEIVQEVSPELANVVVQPVEIPAEALLPEQLPAEEARQE